MQKNSELHIENKVKKTKKALAGVVDQAAQWIS